MRSTILLVGCGRFGRHIATKLNELGHEVLAIDSDENKINEVLPYVTNAQIGNSTDERFLRALGITNFDVCIVAIGNNFQSSLETTSLLKELGAKTVVSRATRDVHEKFLLRNGADYVVYPEKQLGFWTAITYSSDKVFDYIDLGEKLSIMEIATPAEWDGKSVIEVDIRKKHGINILGIRKDGVLDISIGPDTVLKKNENLLVLGTTASISKCFRI
jgi:trk system potassium uptake protein TrkA